MNDPPPFGERAAVHSSEAQAALVVNTSLSFGAQTQFVKTTEIFSNAR
jgi:hypothetical protein